MNDAAILSNRIFNLDDGNRYIILAQINGKTKAYTRVYMTIPKFTENLLEAKTFKDIPSLNLSISNIKINYDYKLYQVKDIFTPRYYVKYSPNPTSDNPFITCANVWSLKDGEESKYVFDDYKEAMDYLQESKMEITEYYYKKIMGLKHLKLIDIKYTASE